MPTYEYLCLKCREQFEVEQKISDDPLKRHEEAMENNECDGRLKKLISRTSFHLKGSGWFSDGY